MTVVVFDADKKPRVGDTIRFSAADILHNWTVRIWLDEQVVSQFGWDELTEREANAKVQDTYVPIGGYIALTDEGKS